MKKETDSKIKSLGIKGRQSILRTGLLRHAINCQSKSVKSDEGAPVVQNRLSNLTNEKQNTDQDLNILSDNISNPSQKFDLKLFQDFDPQDSAKSNSNSRTRNSKIGVKQGTACSG